MKLRTAYSFRTAAGQPAACMERLKAIGATHAPITDRASTYGHVKWAKLARSAGLPPAYGVELAVTSSLSREGKGPPPMDHWAFFAVDGLAPLYGLVELATSQSHYEPLLTYEQALAAEGVLKLTGRRPMLARMEPQDGLWVPAGPSTSPGLLKAARAAGHPLVASWDNHYPTVADAPLWEAVMGGRSAGGQTWPMHILDPAEEAAAHARLGIDAAESRRLVALRSELWGRCRATLPEGKLLVPERPATLREQCVAGAAKLGCDLSRPDYAERLGRELDLIAAKGFENYFFIVGDMMRWARAHLLCGPARGSSCGSLVCYLLEITTIDPLPWGLLFERFIDVNRPDLPDVDVDLGDAKRDMVFDHLKAKYGDERTARLGTVNIFKAKSALKRVAQAMDVAPWKVEALAGSVEKRTVGDERANRALGDALRDTEAGRDLLRDHPEMGLCAALEGHPSHAGQHAAGFLLTDRPVRTYTAVDRRTGATMCDKKDAEALGLLKVDVLGLTQLTVLEEALERAGLPRLHLETVPLDDPAAFAVLNERRYGGVFQAGPAFQNIAKGVPVADMEDIVAIGALSRPGPMLAGCPARWTARRTGMEPVRYPHPLLEPVLRDTLGVLVTQEQIMRAAREVGGMDWPEVTALRRAMGKSMGAGALAGYETSWMAGAVARGMPEAVAASFWREMLGFGSYAFNRSHSVAYALLTYWTLWMKAHHPLEFAAATLDHENDPDRQIRLLRELHDAGVPYLPVDPRHSTHRWEIAPAPGGGRRLVGPLSAVVGLGPRMVAMCAGARARGEPLPAKVQKLLLNPKTKLDSLWPIRDAIRSACPGGLASRNIHTEPTALAEISADDGPSREVLVLVELRKITRKDENSPEAVERRGGTEVMDGYTTSLNLILADDTGELFGKVRRHDHPRLGKPLVDRGKAGKALYAVKGRTFGGDGFKGLTVAAARYLGDRA